LLAAFARLGGPAPRAFTARRWRYADTEPALAIGCEWITRRFLRTAEQGADTIT
jgi:hypothetical protein